MEHLFGNGGAGTKESSLFASDIVVDRTATNMPKPATAVACIDGKAVDVEYDGDSHTCWLSDDKARIPLDPTSIMIKLI